MKSSVSLFFRSKLILVGMILAGFCWVMPGEMKAQSAITSNGFYEAPVGPYCSPTIAMTRVEAFMISIKEVLSGLNPQSFEYNNVYAHYLFYSAIDEALLSGKTVKESLEIGLQFFATTDVGSLVSKTKKAEYKQEAINLLKP